MSGCEVRWEELRSLGSSALPADSPVSARLCVGIALGAGCSWSSTLLVCSLQQLVGC